MQWSANDDLLLVASTHVIQRKMSLNYSIKHSLFCILFKGINHKYNNSYLFNYDLNVENVLYGWVLIWNVA